MIGINRKYISKVRLTQESVIWHFGDFSACHEASLSNCSKLCEYRNFTWQVIFCAAYMVCFTCTSLSLSFWAFFFVWFKHFFSNIRLMKHQLASYFLIFDIIILKNRNINMYFKLNFKLNFKQKHKYVFYP